MTDQYTRTLNELKFIKRDIEKTLLESAADHEMLEANPRMQETLLRTLANCIKQIEILDKNRPSA